MQIFYSNIPLLVYILTSTAGLILIKLAGLSGAPISFMDGKLHLNFGVYAIAGALLYGVSFLIYTYLIAKNDLSYIIPVSTALVYVGIFFASFFIFKEAITALKIVGIFLVVGGVILLNIGR